MRLRHPAGSRSETRCLRFDKGIGAGDRETLSIGLRERRPRVRFEIKLWTTNTIGPVEHWRQLFLPVGKDRDR